MLGREQPTLFCHLLQLWGRGDVTGRYRKVQACLEWVLNRAKARRASRSQHLPPCPQPSSYCDPPPFTLPHPWRARLWERDAVFALGLRASLTLSCLSVGRARSRRLPGRLPQLRVTSAPWLGEGCRGRWRRWRLVRKPPELVLGTPCLWGPHKSPDMRVRSGDWQRSSSWCPRRHDWPPGSGAAEPSTPD